MAPVALNISAQWRPWRQAGLTHLLMDPAEALALREAAVARPAQRPASATPSPRPGTGVPVPSVPAQAGPTQAGQATRAPAPAAYATSSPATTSPVTRPPGNSPLTDGPEALPRDQWPAAWLERLQKTPPRPRIVWTYDRLAQDLAGLGDGKVRGAFFRALFAELGMEAGTHGLWPLAVPPEPGVDALFFVSGMAALNPDTLIFMGEDGDEAFEALGLPRIGPLGTALWRGRRLVRLHGVDRLQEETLPRRNRLLSLIKTLHRPRG